MGVATPLLVEEDLRKRALKRTRDPGLGHAESPSNIVRLLKACTAAKDLHKGSKLNVYVQRHDCLGKNIYIGNTLVSMYAKCGALAKAHQVLKDLPIRDVVSWTALIAGNVQQGQGEEALKRFDDMLREGISPNAVAFICALKACGSVGAVAKGEEIHDKIVNLGMLEKHVVLGNSLIDMYMKCGALAKAQQVFEELPVRDMVSWNALVSGHAQHGQWNEALKCCDAMLHEAHLPDAVTFTCALKACGNVGAPAKGEEIHGKIISMGILDKDIILGSTLIDMYSKCGVLPKAHQVLEELPMRDVVSWSALIAGYGHQGQGEDALKCFDDMLCEGHSANAVAFICALKACGSIRAAAKGKEIHEKVVSLGMLLTDIVLGNALVDMHAKSGALAKAYEVLQELPMHDVVSWNALIGGHAHQWQEDEAFKCFDNMLHEGLFPDAVTFICVLKACGSIGAAAKGEEIHEKIDNMCMLEKNIVLGNALVNMYAQCGALAKARQVFKELPMHDNVSWNALIAGYAEQGKGEEALKCFDDMLQEGHFPNAITFICVLGACGRIEVVAKGEEIHGRIVSLGMLETDVVLVNRLVDMYAKCGALAKAYQVLEVFPMHNMVSWTALIAGHVQQGQGEEALKCFDDMLHEGHSPNAVTFVCVLKACGIVGEAAKGKEIHEKIFSKGMMENNIVLGSTLVDMYAKCGALAKAHQVLRQLPICDVVSWTALIAGYAQQGQGEEALKCFDDMLREGQSPNAVTYICALMACGSIGIVAMGKEVHDKIVSLGMLEKDVVLGNSLIDMYVKCGALSMAYQVLKALSIRDGISWNAIIHGHAQQGQGKEALNCFDDMLHEGHFPDAFTFTCVLKACVSIGAAVKVDEIHKKIAKMGMLEKDIVLGNTLVDMYAKLGALAKAHQVLKELPVRDVVSWNALIAGYAQQGQGEEALKCFDDMLCEGHSTNAVTFNNVLKACGKIGAVAMGEEIHDKIVRLGMLEKDIMLGSSLIDMYMKCGVPLKAQLVLENLHVCNAVSWNALISGYSQQGQGVEVVNCFEQMQSKGVKPNSISMTIVLNACSHSGLLDYAETYFSGMSMTYDFHPSLEHYCCMIDAFARAGKCNKALSVIAEMPYDKCLSSWVALLAV